MVAAVKLTQLPVVKWHQCSEKCNVYLSGAIENERRLLAGYLDSYSPGSSMLVEGKVSGQYQSSAVRSRPARSRKVQKGREI